MAAITKQKKTQSKKTLKVVDVYQDVTDSIIDLMENHPLAYKKGWQSLAVSIPKNPITKNQYSGINVLILWASKHRNSFASNTWMTFKQANEIGANVIKGQKGTTVVFYKTLELENDSLIDENGDPAKSFVPMVKRFTVFNLDQIENIDTDKYKFDEIEEYNAFENDEMQEIEKMVKNYGIQVNFHASNQACYIPSHDKIMMPARDLFFSPAALYRTYLHELSHSTGHQSRLNRPLSGRFGSYEYGKEELIAELSATFLGAHFGIFDETKEQNAAYLKSWISSMKEDKKYIFQVAAAAQKATDLLLSNK